MCFSPEVNFGLHLQGLFLWQRGSPVAYQQFSSPQVVEYKCYRSKYLNSVESPDQDPLCLWYACQVVEKLCVNLSDTRTFHGQKINPNVLHIKEHHHCFLLLLSNLAEPTWIPVKCDNRLLRDIFCFKTLPDEGIVNSTQSTFTTFCHQGSTMKDNNCYCFVLKLSEFQREGDISRTCEDRILHSVQVEEIRSLFFLFDAVPPILLPASENPTHTVHLIHKRVFSESRIQFKEKLKTQAQGFLIYTHGAFKLRPNSNVFRCKNGGFISVLFVCNKDTDCPNDKSDEDSTLCRKLNDNTELLVKPGQKAIPFTHMFDTCSVLYYKTASGECVMFSIRAKINPTDRLELVSCSDGHAGILDDLIADCGHNGTDEPLLQ